MPNFLSKLVKSPGHDRERSDSILSRRSRSRSRNRSSSVVNSSSVELNVSSKNLSRTNSIKANSDTDSLSPNVTVIPPSPLALTHDSLPESDPETAKPKVNGSMNTPVNSPVTSPVLETSRSSPRSFKEKKIDIPPLPVTPSDTLETPMPRIRHSASDKSLNSRVAPIDTTPPPTSHIRAATTPHFSQGSEEGELSNGSISRTPITESPTAMRAPPFPSIASDPSISQPIGRTLTTPQRDSDAVSIASMSPSIFSAGKEKKGRPWRKSAPTSKPSGLASAIAASGLAMANPAASQLSPPASISAVSLTGRRPSLPSSPPVNRTASGSVSRKGGSPRSSQSKRSKAGSPRRRPSVSAHSDANSEEVAPGVADYYSGLEEDSSEESDDDSSTRDDLMDLDLEENAVTGFAVASNKRNSDFHELFPTIPETDYLIEDYGCALQREILIQGRLYISENHICFHANIFGWITDLSIPIAEIENLEKKMTAFVIPNAIQITTRQAKYSFASFLSRDTTFDVIYNIWRLVRPSDSASINSGRGSYEPLPIEAGAESAAPGLKNKKTICACSKEGKHYTETAMDTVVPGTPDRIHNLIFTSGFIKEFFNVNQKLIDLQMADWAPTSTGSKLLGRNMSYIKPLNGSIGPKSTKCEIRDETDHLDFDDYVSTITTTRTPDVPSGGVFSVKTRTCIMWASAVSTRIWVTTQVEWTGRSFIRGIIERSAIDGQKTYHADLEKAMRAYIQEHQSEFIPEGIDMSAITAAPPAAPEDAQPEGATTEDAGKKRERERNQRAWQWAYDTFDGARQVGVTSYKTALELVHDAWDQSSATTMLYFIIVVLVISNIYTYSRMEPGTDHRKKIEVRKMEDREKWIQGVVSALWDELASGKGPGAPGTSPATDTTPIDKETQEFSLSSRNQNLKAEVSLLQKTLDDLEERVRNIRAELNSSVSQLESLD